MFANFFLRLFGRSNSESNNSVTLFDDNHQFTITGLEAATEFYNQKYPERGEIALIFVNTKNGGESFQNNKSLTEACQNIKRLIKKEGARKIIITTLQNGLPHHSHPFILTEEKMVSLYDSEVADGIYEEIAEKLKLNIIHPKTFNDKKFQRDSSSCHIISLGILKDLKSENLTDILNFSDNYIPLPISLKYCQSKTYAERHLKESQSLKTPIKRDGTTVLDYIENHLELEGNILKESRITKKFAKLEKQLTDTDSPEKSPKAIANQALRIASKQKPPTNSANP